MTRAELAGKNRRRLLGRELAELQLAIISGDEDIADLREKISRLCAETLDASATRALLRSCKDRQCKRLAKRARLMAELAKQNRSDQAQNTGGRKEPRLP